MAAAQVALTKRPCHAGTDKGQETTPGKWTARSSFRTPGLSVSEGVTATRTFRQVNNGDHGPRSPKLRAVSPLPQAPREQCPRGPRAGETEAERPVRAQWAGVTPSASSTPRAGPHTATPGSGRYHGLRRRPDHDLPGKEHRTFPVIPVPPVGPRPHGHPELGGGDTRLRHHPQSPPSPAPCQVPCGHLRAGPPWPPASPVCPGPSQLLLPPPWSQPRSLSQPLLPPRSGRPQPPHRCPPTPQYCFPLISSQRFPIKTRVLGFMRGNLEAWGTRDPAGQPVTELRSRCALSRHVTSVTQLHLAPTCLTPNT